jgi:4-alpha-glucanotransferase
MPATEWRGDAVAMTTTHDLPTVAGWWTGVDIATRHAIGMADEEAETKQRVQDRAALWSAFQEAGVAKGGPPDDPPLAVDAAIAFTAQSPAALALIPLEDVLGVSEQPNLPGTIDEHPNWRRRLVKPASELLSAPVVKRRLNTLRERP